MSNRGESIVVKPGFVFEDWRLKDFMWAILEDLRHAEETLNNGDMPQALTHIHNAHGDALLVYEALRDRPQPERPADADAEPGG